MKFCRQCGTLLNDEMIRCPRCGSMCSGDDDDYGKVPENTSYVPAIIAAAAGVVILALIVIVVLMTSNARGDSIADKIMETTTQAVAQPKPTEEETTAEETKSAEELLRESYLGEWTDTDGRVIKIKDNGGGRLAVSVDIPVSDSIHSSITMYGTIEEDAVIYTDGVKKIDVSNSIGEETSITDYSNEEGYFMQIEKDQIDAAQEYGAEIFYSGDEVMAWVVSNEPESESGEYVIWYSSDIELDDEVIAELPLDQKYLAADEIKARHGVVFADESIQSYFEEQSWYKGYAPETYFNEESLTETERTNIEKLQAAIDEEVESQKKAEKDKNKKKK